MSSSHHCSPPADVNVTSTCTPDSYLRDFCSAIASGDLSLVSSLWNDPPPLKPFEDQSYASEQPHVQREFNEEAEEEKRRQRRRRRLREEWRLVLLQSALPLHLAAVSNNIEIIQFLIEQGTQTITHPCCPASLWNLT